MDMRLANNNIIIVKKQQVVDGLMVESATDEVNWAKELFLPWRLHSALSQTLDLTYRQGGVTVALVMPSPMDFKTKPPESDQKRLNDGHGCIGLIEVQQGSTSKEAQEPCCRPYSVVHFSR